MNDSATLHQSSPFFNKLKRRIDSENDHDGFHSKRFLSQSMANKIGILSLNDDDYSFQNNSNNNNNNSSVNNNSSNIFQNNSIFQQPTSMNINSNDIFKTSIIPEKQNLNRNDKNNNTIFNNNINNNNNSPVPATINNSMAIIPVEKIKSTESSPKLIPKIETLWDLVTNISKSTYPIIPPLTPRSVGEDKSRALILYSEPSEVIQGSLRKEVIEKRKQQLKQNQDLKPLDMEIDTNVHGININKTNKMEL
ncbi:hypothetical protein CYY_004918 [Polysphondylium violaceum]|uniref:Uncharacterized protein n=1 Tax=Polysphondylium violaceum TaxID=133409 RepID=A0A8J4V7B6_9MYCE|nr:hypothetical protein CYY_004918 [Polysphondylium violaceum]